MPAPPVRPAQVAVFAKAPVPGLAKTRLMPALGAVGAARLQRQLIRRSLDCALRAGVGPVTLWCAPDAAHRHFRALQRSADIALRTQQGTDLGERMHAGFVHHTPQAPLVLVGTDCPPMQPEHLRQAAWALHNGVDVVCQPAEDGGYVLIGLRQPQALLFRDMPWGTDAVMSITRERALQAGLQLLELPTLWDLDRPDDLPRWRAHRLAELKAS